MMGHTIWEYLKSAGYENLGILALASNTYSIETRYMYKQVCAYVKMYGIVALP